MAIHTKPTFLALMLGGALAAGSVWAQATPAPAEAPAADAAATGEAATGEAATEAPAEAPVADTPAAEAPAADAPAADAPATDAPAAAAPAADAEPQVGAYYTRETHGDWQLRCIKSPSGIDPCELFQLLTDTNDNPVAEAALIPINGDQVAAGLTITAPLETDLGAGVGFQIDAAEMKVYPFSVCVPIGCIARVGLPAAQVDSMRKGAKGKVVVLPYGLEPPEGVVELSVSLSGFTAGYKALETYIDEATKAAAAAGAAAPAPEAAPAAPAAAPEAAPAPASN